MKTECKDKVNGSSILYEYFIIRMWLYISCVLKKRKIRNIVNRVNDIHNNSGLEFLMTGKIYKYLRAEQRAYKEKVNIETLKKRGISMGTRL